jgi:hypothetical protein
MRPDDIKAHQKRQPFRAIRIYVSDGSAYEVRHPEMMFVTRTEVIIGLDNGNGDLPERSVYCDPIHVTRIEPLDGRKRKPPAKPRR